MRRPGLLCAAVLIAVPTALAAPPSMARAVQAQVSVVGGAAVPTHAPSRDQITYTISVGDAGVDAAVLQLTEPAAAPADRSSVLVDNVPAAPGTVDQVGPGLRIRLGAGADGERGGRLAVGNHTVTIDLTVRTLPHGRAAAHAVVRWVAGGHSRHIAARPVGLAMPDLQLSTPTGGGGHRTMPLGTGADGEFQALLANPGGDSASATLAITLPPGLVIDHSLGVYRDDAYRDPSDPGGRRLRCATRRRNVIRCPLGAVRSGADALIDLAVRPLATALVGRVRTVTLAALPGGGVDAHPGDNAVHGSVRFTGTAHLQVQIMARRSRIPVGASTRVTVLVRNDGPDRAPATLALLELRGEHFSIVRFSGRAGPRARGAPIVLWDAGTIRSGGRARAVLTVRARAVGTDQLRIGADSTAGDPVCRPELPSPGCEHYAIASLRALPPRT